MLQVLQDLRLLQRSGFTLASAIVQQDNNVVIRAWKEEPSTNLVDQYLMTIGECMDFIPMFSSAQVFVM